MTIDNIAGLIGGLALFLLGMNLTSDGLETACGNKMKNILKKLTSNRFVGVLVGAIITILIQSLIIFTPFRNLLNLTVLNKNQYLLCYIIPFLFLIFSEFNKKIIAKYFK